MKIFSMILTALISNLALAGVTNVKIESMAATGMCMDAQGDHKADGTKVFMYKCHGHENQRWTVTEAEKGESLIVGAGGFCLDVRGTHSFKDGTPVQLWKCHYGGNQRFRVSQDGKIQEVASGKCLLATHEKDGAAIVLDECGKWKHEKWHLTN